MSIEINKQRNEDTLIVQIDGSLDTNTSPVFRDALEGELDGVKELILDLYKVPHISSAGVRVLLFFLQYTESQGADMKLINVNDVIVELLDTIGFLDMITVEGK